MDLGTCRSCGSSSFRDAQERIRCVSCGNEYRRTPSSEPLRPCPSCGGALELDAYSGRCSDCGEQRRVASAVAGLDGFVSIERRGTALVWLLVVIIGLSVIAVGSDLAEANLLGRIAGGGGWTEAEVDSSDTRQAMLGVLQLLFFIATGLVWLNWFSQAYRNLPALGARDLRFTPGWAVGAWFVPFLNMVRPKQMTDDVWRASDPRAPAVHSGPWKGQRVSPLLHWWWALFLISGIVGQLLVRGGFQDTSTMAGIQSLNTLTTFSDLLDIPLAILAILVVRQIGDRQEERARVLSTMTARA